MTDAQLISLVIALAATPLATLVVVLLGKPSEECYLDAKIEALRAQLTARMDIMESALLKQMAHLDERLSRLEAR